MSGETDLEKLLATMQPVLVAGSYVFATTPASRPPEGLSPRMTFREAEGLTLILHRDEAQAAGLDAVFPCRMITLNVHSSLHAVGFMARITEVLARAGIGVNPVSGFYHDHLFVPEDRAEEALALLRGLSGG